MLKNSTPYRWIFALLAAWLFSMPLLMPALATPNRAPQITDASTRREFPERLHFDISVTSSVPIERVELLFGLTITSCSNDETVAIPADFEAGETSYDLTYTWNFRETGSLPPGAEIWYEWQVTDRDGNVTRTPRETMVWLDEMFPWRTISEDGIALHWYSGDELFARQLLDSAVAAKARTADAFGVEPVGESDLYIYATTEAMRESVLFTAQWTGALAYYQHNIMLIGVNQSSMAWGIETVAHELTHLLVHSVVDRCYAGLPTWLNEGLAVYTEKLDHSNEVNQINAAIRSNSLPSLAAISVGFSEDPTQARLSYAQGYSVVDYLLRTYGSEKMLELLLTFQAGYRQESAFQQVYGLTLSELEADWRADIGAPPAPPSLDPEGDPTPVPTVVPIQPLEPDVVLIPSTPVPTATPISGNPLPPAVSGGGNAWGGMIWLGGFGLLCGVVLIGALIAGFVVVKMGRGG